MLKLAACAALYLPAGEAPAPLAQLRAELGLPSLRRINRFTELALLGAHRCRLAYGRALPADTTVLLVSETPNLSDALRVMRALIGEARPPSPFDFMNTASNMAGFYVAQQLGLSEAQLSLHRAGDGLNAALELLTLPSAPRRVLLGVVEEADWPLAEHRERLCLPPDAPLAECSDWFFLDADCVDPLALIDV